MSGLAAVIGGGAGGFIGWWVGLALCPDWGDLGTGAIGWAVGGAIVGAAAGAFIGAEVVG